MDVTLGDLAAALSRDSELLTIIHLHHNNWVDGLYAFQENRVASFSVSTAIVDEL